MDRYEVNSVYERSALDPNRTRWYATIRDRQRDEIAAYGAGATKGEAIDDAWNKLVNLREQRADAYYADWQRAIETIAQQGEDVQMFREEYKALSDDYDRLAQRNDQMHSAIKAAMHLLDTCECVTVGESGWELIATIVKEMLFQSIKQPAPLPPLDDIPF